MAGVEQVKEIGGAVDIDAKASATAALLLVDDEVNIISSLRRLFRSEGYKIFTANSGIEGLEVLQSEPVDVVISDMRMPQMDGAEFLSKVAKKWPKTERILLTGFSDLESTVEAVNKGHIYRYVSKPWEDGDLRLTVAQALEKKHIADERDHLLTVTQKQNEQLKQFNLNLERMVVARTEEIQQTADMLDLAYKELNRSYIQLMPLFSNLIEMREGGCVGHSRRVGEMAKGIAERMGLHEEEVQDIYFSALLHDIGKMGLPDNLLDRAYHSLSSADKNLMAKHSVIGQAVLVSVESLESAAANIRGHHECFDGAGYPDGLKGEKIPLGARILAVANDFDVLQRGGGPVDCVLSVNEAAAFIESNAGVRYDPEVVTAFVDWFNDSQGEIESVNELALMLNELHEGMELSRDLINKQGILLLSKGHVLDERLIERIKFFERDEDSRYTVFVKN